MRGMFGLVSILVVAAILFYVFTENTAQVAKTSQAVTPKAQQLAGRDAGGGKAIDAAKFSDVNRNGAISGLKVVSIKPGTLQDYWGLMPGDIIQGIGIWRVGESPLDTSESCIEWVSEGMQRKFDMKVNRGGTIITLPGGAPVGANTPKPSSSGN